MWRARLIGFAVVIALVAITVALSGCSKTSNASQAQGVPLDCRSLTESTDSAPICITEDIRGEEATCLIIIFDRTTHRVHQWWKVIRPIGGECSFEGHGMAQW